MDLEGAQMLYDTGIDDRLVIAYIHDAIHPDAGNDSITETLYDLYLLSKILL
jgi:hypothetical protein